MKIIFFFVFVSSRFGIIRLYLFYCAVTIDFFDILEIKHIGICFPNVGKKISHLGKRISDVGKGISHLGGTISNVGKGISHLGRTISNVGKRISLI